AAGATVPAGAPAHLLLSRATGTWTQAAADPQVAIEAVIQKANSEQAQALASGNPALMSDTATTAYYRQSVQTNQGMATQGATGIELTQLTGVPSRSTATPPPRPRLKRGSRRSATARPLKSPTRMST